MEIPPTFAQNMRDLYGAAGEAWLQGLPALIADCERRWDLNVMAPLAPLSYNYVAVARRADGAPAVLKLGVPRPDFAHELTALQHYAGEGCAQVLASDAEQGAILLERLIPGMPLGRLTNDEQATAIAAAVMQRLWRTPPPDHGLPSVADWAAGLGRLRAEFGGATGPFPANLVAQAETLFAELLASMDAPVVLHGDLHHDNILAADRQPWLAIDPHGVIGEPAYEVGAFLRNPLPRLLEYPRPIDVLSRRIAIFSDAFGIDRERLAGWGMAQAVLSAWWSYEDHGAGWEPSIQIAGLLALLV